MAVGFIMRSVVFVDQVIGRGGALALAQQRNVQADEIRALRASCNVV
jgi:hypothetical protein